MLGLRTSGIYHTDFPQYVRILTDDASLETLTWNYMQWFYGQLDLVYVNTEGYRRAWIDRGIPPERLRILPRGLDTALFHPSRREPDFWHGYGIPRDKTVLLYVGRVSREKDLDVIVSAWSKMRGDGTALAFVGDGPYLKELRERVPDAAFTGYLAGLELARAFASADVFIFPSTTDTFGNVVLEAHGQRPAQRRLRSRRAEGPRRRTASTASSPARSTPKTSAITSNGSPRIASCARRCAPPLSTPSKTATGPKPDAPFGKMAKTSNTRRRIETMKIPLSFLILAATQTLALASVTDELFDQLKTELRAEIKAQKDNGREEPSRTTQMLMQVVEMRARGGEEDGDFLASLEGLEVISANDKVQQIAKALATELRKEQEQTEAARAERNEHTLGDAVKTLLDAKTAKDLDAPLIAVGNLVHENNDGFGSGYSKNQKLRTQGAQVQQFWEYLRQWQNYLSDIEAGDAKAAKQQLQNLSNSERDFSGFIPRSTLLEKLKTLEKATGTGDEDPHETTSADREKRLDAILDGIKSLDDLPGCDARPAEAIRRQGGGTASTKMARSRELRTMARVYSELKQGFATNFSLPSAMALAPAAMTRSRNSAATY